MTSIYLWSGVNWGWSLVDETTSRPYICEIGRADIYQIISQDRSFGTSDWPHRWHSASGHVWL